jgi:hypothetical protein
MRAWPAPGVVLALTACGRLGFQGGPDDAADLGETITLIVTSDEYLSEPAGMPIRDATVLIDRGTGVFERALTDGTGTVRFSSDGVVAYHVVYLADIGWRIYTAQTPRPGTYELGGRAAVNLNRSMTVTVPSSPDTLLYTLNLPEQCAIPFPETAPTFAFSFDPACEGRAVRAVVFRRTNTTDFEYLDGGTIALTNGSTYNVTGSYQAAAQFTVQLTNLPSTPMVFELAGDVALRTGADFTSVLVAGLNGVPEGSSATMANPMAAGGDALRVALFVDSGTADGIVEHIKLQPIAATMSLDISALLPPFASLTVDLPLVSWTGGSTAGSWIAVEAFAGMLQWNAYAPPSATFVRFPAIPPDLGVPVIDELDLVVVTKLDVPGSTAGDMGRRFDRTWAEWPNSTEALSPEGGSRAQIRDLSP